MAFAISAVINLAMKEKNENGELDLRTKQEPLFMDSEQNPSPAINSTAKTTCIYSGLEAIAKLESTKIPKNEAFCKLEKRNPEDEDCIEINTEGKKHDTKVKMEIEEISFKDVKLETLPGEGYMDDGQGDFQKHLKLKEEAMNEVKADLNVKKENNEEEIKLENEEEFLSGDEFLSDNECCEFNENVTSQNIDGLSSSEDEDTTAANLDKNLKKLIQFENPNLGDIIDIYKNYNDLWDANKSDHLDIEKRNQVMLDMCDAVAAKLSITLTIQDLKKVLLYIHKTFSSEKEKRFKCEIEQKEFSSVIPNLNKCEFLEDHQGPFKCTKCNAIILQHGHFHKHISQHSNKCDVCGKVCLNKHALKFHKSRAHNINIFFCVVCDISFDDEKVLKKHKNDTHSVERTCEICGKRFRNRNSLQHHYYTLHVEYDQTKLQCKICGHISRNLKGFYNHSINHNSKRHNCGLCEKSFRRKTSLKDHILVAHEGKRLPCKYCDATFGSTSRLFLHERVCKSKKDMTN